MASLIIQTLRATALAALLAGTAHAQQAPSTASDSDWRFFGMLNVTFGGDTIAPVTLNGEKANVKAGGGLQAALGVEYVIDTNWSLSSSVGYHFDETSGKNAKVSFDRLPIEMMTHYSANPQLKFGAGLRASTGAKASTSGDANAWPVDRGDYKASTGFVIEAEYFLNENKKASLVGRFVQESYKHNSSGKNYDGNHFGIGFKAYF